MITQPLQFGFEDAKQPSSGNDQFFTRPEVSQMCWQRFSEWVGAEEMARLHFVEPSAGSGAFFNLLPEGRRTGLDLDPMHPEVQLGNFLHWFVPDEIRPWAMIGNPPFGYRGSLAIQFLNHAFSQGARYAGFILPPGFEYGYAKRVGAIAVRQIRLDEESFVRPDGKPYNLPCVFQFWRFGAPPAEATCNKYVRIHNINGAPDSLIDRCDAFCLGCAFKAEHLRIHTEAFGDHWPTDMKELLSGNTPVLAIEIVCEKERENLIRLLCDCESASGYSYLGAAGRYFITIQSLTRYITNAGYRDG